MHRKGDIRLIFIIRLLCIKIQLVSQWHTSSLVSVMFGRLLSLLSHLQGTAMRHFIGLFVNLATLMIVVLLFLAEALDEHIRLDKKTAALDKRRRARTRSNKNPYVHGTVRACDQSGNTGL